MVSIRAPSVTSHNPSLFHHYRAASNRSGLYGNESQKRYDHSMNKTPTVNYGMTSREHFLLLCDQGFYALIETVFVFIRQRSPIENNWRSWGLHKSSKQKKIDRSWFNSIQKYKEMHLKN